MANIIKLLFYLQFCYLITIINCDEYNEIHARQYVNDANSKLTDYYNELSEITFGQTQHEYQMKFSQLKAITNNIAELTKNAQKYQLENFQDTELIQSIRNIKKSAYLLILGNDYYDRMLNITSQFVRTSTRKNLCEYEEESCQIAYLPDVRRLMSNAHRLEDINELKYYWLEWRKHNERFSKHVFPNFVQLLAQAAAQTNISVKELWYHEYGTEESNLIQDIDRVMKQIQPLYTKMHALIRFELNLLFGDGVLKKNGLIPHHLLEIVMAQAWKKDSIIQESYPYKKLPNLKTAMDMHGLNGAENIIKEAAKFYETLGLEANVDQLMMAQNTMKLKPKDKMRQDCKAELYDKTPKIRLEYCPQSNFKKFLQAHGWMGRIHYARNKKSLPFAFYQSYQLEQAFGEAGILSASTPKHIKTIGILPNYTYTEEMLLNRLYRMGLHTLFNIPIYYVHVKVMDDLFSGKTNYRHFNEHYWKLMEEFVGVEPPFDRSRNSFDLPHKFYEGLENNQQTTKFISEIAGYQIYESLCTESKQFTPNTNSELHNCDFSDNDLSDKLINMMSIGSKISWRQILNQITNSTHSLNGQSLLDYYKPLEKWLEEVIRLNEKEIPVGLQLVKGQRVLRR